MRPGIAGLLIGLVFGAVLCWSGMSSPDVIRGALLLEHSYLFLFFASAVTVAGAGTWLLRRRGGRALLTGERLGWKAQPPARRHIVGSVVFGIGWAVSDACPGPVATQLGQGIAWSLWTFAGVVIGVTVYLRRRQPETEPASDAVGARGLEPVPARA